MIEISYDSTTAGTGPNLSLKPSTSTNLELGSKWLVNDDTRVNLALFDIATENEIVIQGTSTYTVYNNAGKTHRSGAELSAETRLPNNFGLFMAYTMLDARFDGSSTYNAGKTIPGTYAAQVFAEATWKYQPVNFLTGLEFRHNSRTYVKDDNSDFAPSYTILSLRASLQQQNNSWRFTEYLRIDNLADEKTIGSVRINDSFNRSFEPAPGRNWLIGVKANYIF
jgi:iron complex outermembrane receptor protein